MNRFLIAALAVVALAGVASACPYQQALAVQADCYQPQAVLYQQQALAVVQPQPVYVQPQRVVQPLPVYQPPQAVLYQQRAAAVAYPQPVVAQAKVGRILRRGAVRQRTVIRGGGAAAIVAPY
jgi:hypothetical protein